MIIIQNQSKAKATQGTNQKVHLDKVETKLDAHSVKLRGLNLFELSENRAYAAKAVADIGEIQENLLGRSNSDKGDSTMTFGGGNGGMSPKKAAQTLLDNLKFLDVAAGEKDGAFGLTDLAAIVKSNPGLPQEVRDAADFLIQNPAVFKAIDASVGGLDGKITTEDLQAFLNGETTETDNNTDPDTKTKWTPHKAIKIILENYDEIAPKVLVHTGGMLTNQTEPFKLVPGTLSYPLLRELRDDPGLAEELREAIGYLLDNPSLLKAIDIAGYDSRVDGRVGKHNLKEYLSRNPESKWDEPATPVKDHNVISVAEVFLKYFDMLDVAYQDVGGAINDGRLPSGPRKDGLIGRSDLETAYKDNANLPEELKTAIEYLLQNHQAFDRLDSAQSRRRRRNRKDGLISRRDLLKIING